MAISSLISKLFGNKYDRDMKEVEPFIKKIKEVYPQIERLSHDELRQKSVELRERIQGSVKAEQDKINELRQQTESNNVSVSEKEKIYREIDRIEKEISEKLEQALTDALPEAFSIVKDTARRFAQNETIEVIATQFDRDLSASKDFLEIKESKAVYHNSWLAGGNTIPLGHDSLRCSVDRWCGASQW